MITTLTALVAFSMPPSTFADSPTYSAWQKALSTSKSLSADVTVFEVGGTQSSYKISLEKPNKIKLVRGDETIVADGNTVSVLNTKTNSFYKKPQTDDELRIVLSSDQFTMFTGFFAATTPQPMSSEDRAARTLAGEKVTEFNATFDKTGQKVHTFYASADGIVRRAQLNFQPADKSKESLKMVFNAKNVVVNGVNAADAYAFVAPKGATEINYADMISSKWFYDFQEASLIAKQTNKMVFIDFMASWCGPCKMMDRDVFGTEEFKALGKKLIFCKVDIDFNPALASKFGVSAIPNMFVVRADGTTVGSIMGYSPANVFVPKLEALISSAK